MNPALRPWAGARRMRCALAVLSWIGAGAVAAAPPLAATPKPATHTVVIEGVKFTPATVNARVGDTIVWVNKDPFPHTATAKGKFDSGNIDSGRSWRYKLKTKGTFPYICTLHPNMLASLEVQ